MLMIKFVCPSHDLCNKTFHFILMMACTIMYPYRKTRGAPAVWIFADNRQGARMPATVSPYSRAITQLKAVNIHNNILY